ncbi:mucin-associated surface protein (MASP), putative [Trypanosoma cruzi marinkellei]|uniref:Mucin-associated surface protein (MASP), putative n=1 Tax=Trypanosoma cruzi marinkellei TaxID=85056 RepID=K2MU41_TRYCR|nr:mucin-associated surface protein (MASP), putative [Trypanosoma cruzi marinkellei]
MAMMMTGRVLLVCALCVLWCGAGGGDALFFGNDDEMNEYYYGVNSTYCKYFPGNFFKCNNKNENTVPAADSSVKGGSRGQKEGEADAQLVDSGPAGTPGKELKGSDAGEPGNVDGKNNANTQVGKENTAPPAESETEAGPGPGPLPPLPAPSPPPPPSEPSNVPNSTNPDQSATPSGTTELQSAQQLQSPPPVAEETTATGDSSPETAAASDVTQSTPAGGDAEPTSPSPAGQAAASGPGENFAAEGTPDGTPPSVAAVTHDDNANTTDTGTSEGNSTAAGMPAPLSSAPTKSALDSSVGNDACFHDTGLHARLLLVLAAFAYGTLG